MKDGSVISTDTPCRSNPTIHVYFNPRPTTRVCLRFPRDELGDISLGELIRKCVQTLNDDYLLSVDVRKFAYCIFPANKTGSKRDGYPELDSKLNLSKINMRRFYLEEVNKSFSLISTEFNLERKYGLERKSESNGFCCRIFSLLRA